MLVTMLRCKLHRATVTECDLHYQGSLKIDADLIKAAGFLPNEHIEVYNIDNGERFATYVIEGQAPAAASSASMVRRRARPASAIASSFARMRRWTWKRPRRTSRRIVVLGATNKIDRITDKPTVE